MLKIQQNLTTVNYSSRGTNPTWIVLHYTANNGDTAYNNTSYFKNVNRGASATYFVDETSIWQCVLDTNTAWHVGNDWYNNEARNTNSIGIEMCSRKRDAFSSSLETYYIPLQTTKNAVELTAYLMQKYNIPITRVCRHYDVTGKYCPAPMVYNNGDVTWKEFLELVQEEVNGVTESQCREIVNAATAPLIARAESAEKRLNTLEKKYDYVSDCPEWCRGAIRTLVDNGVILGTDKSKNKGDDVYVRLTYTECRIFYLLLENGVFDNVIE